MWLATHLYNQLLLLLLLCTACHTHSHGQHLAKRVVLHLYSPQDMGEIIILYLSLCIYNLLFRPYELPWAEGSLCSWFVLCQVKNQEKGAGVDQTRAEYPKAFLGDGRNLSGGHLGEQLEGAG